MTTNRARKSCIRARMKVTGEKYMQAMRAIDAERGAHDGERGSSVDFDGTIHDAGADEALDLLLPQERRAPAPVQEVVLDRNERAVEVLRVIPRRRPT